MAKIKDRIMEVLQAKDMTASELAAKSGIGKGSISKYLKGTVVPKQSAIGAMARALGVSPAWLLGYDVPMLTSEIDFNKLSEDNQKRLLAYYQALIDSQEG